MNNIVTQLTIATSLVFLVACGGGGGSSTSSSSSSSSGGTSSLSLITASGSTIDTNSAYLSSISTACYDIGAGLFAKDTIALVESTYTYTNAEYSDNSCTTLSSTYNFTADVTVDQNTTTGGWVDGQNLALDPPPLYASSATVRRLPANANYTRLNFTIKTSTNSEIIVGTTLKYGFVIDNTITTGFVLYRVPSNGYATDADPYTNIVSNGYITGEDYFTNLTYMDNTSEGILNNEPLITTVDSYYSTSSTSANIKAIMPLSGFTTESLQLILPFDFTVGNLTDVNGINVKLTHQNELWQLSADANNFINITTADNVGGNIIGTYKAKVCKADCLPFPLSLSGRFTITRGENR